MEANASPHGLLLKVLMALVLVTGAMQPIASHACETNFDCELGSRCVRESGQMIGACLGGMNPGNSNDRRPGRISSGTTDNIGKTCSTNFDCDLGARCVKSGGMEGVCLKNR